MSSKPHCAELHKFSKKWSWKKTILELADEKIEKIAEVSKQYLTTTLEFLSYTIEKSYVDELEDKFQDNLRKQRRN